MIIPTPSRQTFYGFGRVLLFYFLSILVFATVTGVAKHSIYPDTTSMLISTLLTFGLVVLFAKWDKLTLAQIGILFHKYSLPRFLSGFGIGFLMVFLQAVIVSNFAAVT